MVNPTASAKPVKPQGCPFTPHRNGQWCKKIRGRLHYFGPWVDLAGAMDLYRRIGADLHAGRMPRPEASAGMEVETLANLYLDAKRAQADRGEIQQRTFNDYVEFADRLVNAAGAGRRADDLRPDDFGAMLTELAEKWGPVRRRRFITFTRGVFRWGVESGQIDRAPLYGPDFKPAPKKVIRQMKSAAGDMDFTPAEFRRLLKCAGGAMRAMILLGANCGMGNTDLARMPDAVVKGATVVWSRPKTGVGRQSLLWPETVRAIAVWRRQRPKGKEGAVGLLFITKYGNPWMHGKTDSIGLEFGKVMDAAGIEDRRGRGFYSLRRTFRTLADEVRDGPAIDRIMGHATPGVGAGYVQRIEVKRLKAVTDHVRKRLLGGRKPTGGKV